MKTTLFYDTECFENLFLASFCVDGKFVDFVFHNDVGSAEKEKMIKFYGEHNKAEDLFVSFNGLAYDNLMLTRFMSVPDITLSQLHDYNNAIINATDEERRNFKPVYTKKFVDVMLMFVGRVGLKEMSARAGLENIMGSSIPFDKKELTEEDVTETINYCHNDVMLTRGLYESAEVTDAVNVRTILADKFDIPLKNALRWSSGTLSDVCLQKIIAKDVVIKKPTLKYKVSDILYPKLEYKTDACKSILKNIGEWERDITTNSMHSAELELGRGVLKFGVGGIHYNTKTPFVFTGDKDNYILDVDINSHYPTMIVNNLLGPEGIEKEYSEALSKVMKLRADAKTKGESGVYKLIANTATGKLKYENSVFYSPRTNETMTINGQLMVLELVESLHLSGFVFVQVNTDGLSVFMQTDRREEFDVILDTWSNKWSFGMKASEYITVINRDVNNYLSIDAKGEIKCKGFFKSYPDKPNTKDYPIVVKSVVDYLLRGTPVADTIRSGKPKEYTRFAKRKVWELVGVDGFNSRGMNRFYIGRDVVNSISGYFSTELKGVRVVTNESNVLSANDINSVDLNKVDYDAYTQKAEKVLASYRLEGLPQYNENMRVFERKPKKTAGKKAEGESSIRELTEKAELLSPGSTRLAVCPVCGGDKRAVLYNEGSEEELIKCFGCDAVLRLEDLITPCEAPECPRTKSSPEVEVDITDDISTRKHLDVASLPDCVWKGSVGAIAEAVGERSWKVLNGALSARQALIGRNISGKYRKGFVYGNMYTMTTGRSGSGKSLVKDIVYHTLGKEHKILPGVESGQALFHAVSRSEEIETGENKISKSGKKSEKEMVTVSYPTPVVLVFEEFMSSLKKSGYENSTLDQELCALFHATTPYGSCSQRNLKEKGLAIQTVDNPEVSIVATLIAEQFRAHFNPDRQMSGFLNRFIVFPEDEMKWDQFDDGDFDFDGLKGVFNELRERKQTIDGKVRRRDYMTVGARAVYDRCTEQLLRPIGESDLAINIPYTRLPLYFFVIALGYAYEAGRYDCIDTEDALAAEAIVWASRAALLKLLDPAEAPLNIPQFAAYQNALAAKVEGYVRNHPGKTKRVIGMALQRYGQYSEIGKVLETLSGPDAGVIRTEQLKQPGEGGQMVTVYSINNE